MQEHQFTLILSGVSELTSELADALYTATDGDIELSMRQGIVRLDVERAAPSLQEAIRSAIEDVEGADLGVRVLRVESDTANTIARLNAGLLSAPVTAGAHD